MKLLGLLQEFKQDSNAYLKSFGQNGTVDEDFIQAKEVQDRIEEAIKEVQELNSVLTDLFTCIEFTEDENAEKRLSSMETYLIRLARFKSE